MLNSKKTNKRRMTMGMPNADDLGITQDEFNNLEQLCKLENKPIQKKLAEIIHIFLRSGDNHPSVVPA